MKQKCKPGIDRQPIEMSEGWGRPLSCNGIMEADKYDNDIYKLSLLSSSIIHLSIIIIIIIIIMIIITIIII